MTLAFAICWLPIHILELFKCSNSSLLNDLIASYPKLLYSTRAFTHALGYFNSCFNPFLYALLNRNFCLDLADVIPSFRTCCQQADAPKTTGEILTNVRYSGVKMEKNHPMIHHSSLIDEENDDDSHENEMHQKLLEPEKTNLNLIYFDAMGDRISVISH